MKAIISSTYDDKYLYFLPIVTWAWNRIGVDVVCFTPDWQIDETFTDKDHDKLILIDKVTMGNNAEWEMVRFNAPKHKQATYAQCSRLYGACLDLDEDEYLVSSDIDMAVFKQPVNDFIFDKFTILGTDLVPKGQYPVCYCGGTVKLWRDTFNLNGINYQQALDRLLGDDECLDYRACRWSVDQEQLFLNISKTDHFELPRSNGQNQFAQNRVDRDDTNWRAYVNDDLIDAHLWRDGYTDQNHANIMELFRMKYPHDDFTWLDNYRNEYLKLL